MKAVQKHATRGDPQSAISAIDYYCRHREWAMNIGDEKGQSTAFVFQTCQKKNYSSKMFRGRSERNFRLFSEDDI